MSGPPPLGLGYEAPKTRRRVSYLLVVSCLPLAFSLIEVPWYFAANSVASHYLGHAPPSSAQSELEKGVAVIPIALGSLLGMAGILLLFVKRRATSGVMWASVFVGLVACSIGGMLVNILLGYP